MRTAQLYELRQRRRFKGQTIQSPLDRVRALICELLSPYLQSIHNSNILAINYLARRPHP